MMKKKSQRHLNFYSNVYLSGDKIHYIGYENGERVQYKESFSPVLYARCNEKTKYKTLEGHYVKEMPFSSVKDAREFTERLQNITFHKVGEGANNVRNLNCSPFAGIVSEEKIDIFPLV